MKSRYLVSFFIWGLFTQLYLWTHYGRDIVNGLAAAVWHTTEIVTGQEPFVSVSSSFEVFIAITVIPGEVDGNIQTGILYNYYTPWATRP